MPRINWWTLGIDGVSVGLLCLFSRPPLYKSSRLDKILTDIGDGCSMAVNAAPGDFGGNYGKNAGMAVSGVKMTSGEIGFCGDSREKGIR